ncbi:MAG: olfactory receptor family 4A protein [Prevotellaceae bacterium]|nr:olfactory receptor family 4A protein [Prevotellaceae bacterium]
MLHIPAKSITILQVEKEALEPVYDFLKEEKHKDVFIQPQEKEIERYIYESKKPVVLLPLVSKSPLQKVNKVTTTTLEKLIVDLYSDQKLFAAFQGSELAHIVNNAYNRYAIDFTKLLHYAKRRKKDLELIRLFKDNTDIPQNIFR